ncbi:membrane-spanning 4-domains subfamily A member 4A-like isoform 2-T2 [Leptodactylus fuscus]|uniref:membrane-spanning 4-domains subfamily A member 4A-like isoform X2 n=1 Tax=Leptodactylus fuscus TaxID=238119 RepID=UPI003F4E4686
MSPDKANTGEFVIISQVRQNDKPEEGQLSSVPASMPKPVVAFYRGEPEVLGTTQIFTGILLISIGIVLTILIDIESFMGLVVISGILIWSGLLFIISGSRSVVASVKPAVGKVTSILVMNIISSLAAACGIILSAIDLSFGQFVHSSWPHCAHYKSDAQCLGNFYLTTVVIYQTTSLNVSDPTRDLPPDSSAAMTSDLKTQT